MRRLALVGLGLALAGCGGGGSEPVNAELRNIRTFEPVGTVRLEEADGGTQVEVEVRDIPSPSSPAIRGGFCAELRPREYKLSEFENGRSVTDLDVALEDLLARQAKVTVSRGEGTPHRVVACTELPYDGPEPQVVVADLVAGGADRGLAWLEPADSDQTRVGILLFDVISGPEPARITTGGCRGETAHELTEIRESESVTLVEATLDSLADGTHWIVAGDTCGRIQPPT